MRRNLHDYYASLSTPTPPTIPPSATFYIKYYASTSGTWAKKFAKILFMPPSDHDAPPASR